MSRKYIEGLLKLLSKFGGVKKARALALDVDETEIKEGDERVGAYRSGVGTLLYIAGDRPDIQYMVKELAGHLQKPTEGSWNSLLKLAGYLSVMQHTHAKMRSQNKSSSFRGRARGLTSVPIYEEDEEKWLLEVKWRVIQTGQERRAEVPRRAEAIGFMHTDAEAQIRHLSGRLLWPLYKGRAKVCGFVELTQ